MNPVGEIVLKGLRKVICYVCDRSVAQCVSDPQVASDKIYTLLLSPNPCMIARFGSTEMNAVRNYLSVCHGPDVRGYLTGKSYQWWWNKKGICLMKTYSGFFPNDSQSIELFCKMMLEDAKQVDLLGSWVKGEDAICPHIGPENRVLLRYLEPFWSDIPWTKALEGKRVLVVHPFADLIETQYTNNRSRLFVKEGILPEFKLVTVKAVQSLGGKCDDFKTWFDALNWMKEEISKEEFDIALIGCGAYGFPLAAHVKRMGKKAVHLGGALQLLFGIRGKRWENPMYGVKEWGIPFGFYSSMMNEFWVSPGGDLRPVDAHFVEGGCYW